MNYSIPSGSSFPQGSTPVTVSTQDAAGNASSCTFNVNVGPPTNLSCNATTTLSDCAVNTGTITINPSGGTPPYDYSIDGGANFSGSNTFTGLAPGTYNIVVVDANGCLFDPKDATVGSNDNTAPVITCPANQTVNNMAGACAAVATFSTSATDNCDPNPTVTCSHPSGSAFPVGTTVVTCTATDNSGNTSNCSFTVTVNDNEAPNMVCNDIIVNLNAAGTASITAADIDGGSTDNCGITLSTSGQTSFDCADNSTTVQVTLIGTDPAGNTSTCIANVTIADPLAVCCALPVANCQDYTVSLDGAGNATISVGDVDAGSVADCGLASIAINSTSFNCGNVGANTVVLTITDVNGASATCTSTVTVVDDLSPIIACPADAALECGDDYSTATLGSATASDNCGVASITSSDNLVAGSCAGNYTILRTWTASDINGNSSSCVQTIDFTDTTAPPIDVDASDLTVECDGSGNSAALNDWLASNGGAALGMSISGGTAPDTIVYEIPLNQTNLAFWGCSSTGGEYSPYGTVADLNWTDVGNGIVTSVSAEINQNWDCQTSWDVQLNGNSQGTYASGSSCSCGLTSYENSLPIGQANYVVGGNNLLQIVGSYNWIALEGNPAWNGAFARIEVVYEIEGDCDGEITWTNDFAGLSDDCGATGSTTVNFTATDECGNAASTSATFTIEDTTAPTITCPDDEEIECDEDSSPAGTGMATASDVCGGATVSHSDVNVAGGCPQQYTILRTWTAVDDCGNTSSCVQTIDVDDTSAPILTCPGDEELECDEDNSPANTGMATATDNCDTDVSINFADVRVDGSCINEYTILRTWTAVDDCGNTTTCTQTIDVEDTTAPVLTCPADATLECTENTTQMQLA